MTNDLRYAVIAFAAVAVAITALLRLDFEVAVIGHVGSALIAVTLLYAPVVVAWRRREDLATYGFKAAPLGRGLALGVGLPALIFPLFIAGYIGFYSLVCHGEALAALAPPGACARFLAHPGIAAPELNLALAEYAAIQLVVVALPEELFFRGCLLHLLERALPPGRRLLHGGVGWALVISAAMFALIHIPRDGNLHGLATFFPGLLFGWMRSATGSILAPTLAHAASNVLIAILDQKVLGQ